MVTLDQLIEVILLETGQFVADLDATLLDKAKIGLMIQRELGLYSRYMPNKQTVTGNLFNGKVFTELLDGVVPTNIIDIRTDRISQGVLPFGTSQGPVHNYYWKYNNGTLNLRYPDGVYTYSFIGPHVYADETISSINLHDRFINLLVGRFLMVVGKSRRAFTIDEIPIKTDASEMIAEGKELYDNTMEEIRTNSAFYFAVLI